jgi:hypothetical protein
MGRGGSRGGSSRGSSRGRSSSPAPPSRSATTATKPVPAQNHAQTPTQTQPKSQGFFGSIGSTIMQGFAFGAGSAVAHQAVRSVMGGSSSNSESQPQEQQQ